MFCKFCGHEVPEGQAFCGNCGANQNAQPGQPAKAPKPASSGMTPETGSLIMKIIAFVLAAVYAVCTVRNVIHFFIVLVRCFRLMGVHFGSGLFLLLANPLTTILLAIVYAAAAVMLVALALKKDDKYAVPLFTGICATSALTVVIAVLRVILFLITGAFGLVRFTGWFSMFILPILFAVIAAGGAFLALYLNGINPLKDFSADKLKGMLAEIIPAVKSAFSKTAPAAPAAAPEAPAAAPEAAVNASAAPQATPVQAPVPGAPVRLTTDRSLLKYILLTIVTCGIYSWFFLHSMAHDTNIACEGDGKTTGGLVKFILLTLVTCGIYAWYWYYTLGNRLAANAPRYGLTFPETGTTVLLWFLFGALLCGIGPFIAMNILIKNTNSICAAYNQAHGL